MIRIFLTNLGKYNEGILVGEWVDLPVSDNFEEVLKRIGISNEPDEDGNYYEEWFITDYETDFGMKIDEYENIFELNELAEELENMEDYEKEIMEVLLDDGYSFEEAINKKDNCFIYYDCHDMEDVAIEYCDQTGILNDIPENLRNYFDFKAYGRDMKANGHFVFTDEGNCIEISCY